MDEALGMNVVVGNESVVHYEANMICDNDVTPGLISN